MKSGEMLFREMTDDELVGMGFHEIDGVFVMTRSMHTVDRWSVSFRKRPTWDEFLAEMCKASRAFLANHIKRHIDREIE